MTITDALQLLTTLKDKHGDVDVYFDCPFCGKSYAPNVVKAQAVHLSSESGSGNASGLAGMLRTRETS